MSEYIENRIDEEDVEVLNEDLEIDSPQSVDDLLMNDRWFAVHPDKVLGEPYEATSAYGPITKYRGDMSALARIEADDTLISTLREYLDPVASVTDTVNVATQILKPDAEASVEAAIDQANEAINRKKRAKKRPDMQAMTAPVGELVTFEQMYRKLNPDISRDELEAFVWWKSSIRQPLSANFVALLHPDRYGPDDDMRRTVNYSVPKTTLAQWMRNGVLCYYKGDLVPAVVYLSGDMYDKKVALDNEAEKIVELYGEEALNAQRRAMEEAFQKVREKRLVISQDRNSIVIKPFSKFAAQFMVGTLQSMEGMDVWRIKKISSEQVGKIGDPDIIGDLYLSEYDRNNKYKGKADDYEYIPLPDAFGWWLLNKKPELQMTVSHREIYEHYVRQKSIRIKGDTSDDDAVKAKAQATRKRIEQEVQLEGERLFPVFLDTELSSKDKLRLETQWNADFNNYLPPNLNKVPVAFTMAKYVFGKEEDVKPEKREAVAHSLMNGTAIISYDVGVGKTPSAIFTISAFLDAGYCKRPCIVVPNQVYKQFISEIKMFTPHIPVTELYNMGNEYLSALLNENDEVESVPEGSISMMTYDGMELVGFSPESVNEIVNQVFEIVAQGVDPKKDARAIEKLYEKAEAFAGTAQMGSAVSIETLGFDFMCYDEAHAMKKVFTRVKGEMEEDEKGEKSRGKNPYQLSSGEPSNRALKGFAINQYILRKNGNKNVIMLTATPFTNSPLEIYSMLSMVAYQTLVDEGISSIKLFFDTFIRTSNELVINTRLRPQFKEVVLGFNNATALRTLIRRFIIYKTGNDIIPPIKRPKKVVLPLTKRIENGRSVTLPEGERVDTFISMTPLQKSLMDEIVHYVETGEAPPGLLGDTDLGEEEMEEGGVVSSVSLYARGGSVSKSSKGDEEEIGMKILPLDKQAGIRSIQGLNLGRNLTVSPYLLPFSQLGDPDYRSYIETSPKLTFVMRCIQSVREYHLSRNEPVSGQVIFLDRGVQYIPLVKEYLVKVVGYAPNEVGIIKSGLPKKGPTSKEYVKNLFNGEIYNEQTKTFETVPDSQRVKVVIGTSTIKEGMNLQKYGTTLYNCFIDWNPTDMQQLEGRIWRQKNTFDAVRIVNALLVDSTDIFLFQKLQEKTARLQSIWANDNNNVIELEELNMEEVKYALIKNPVLIAEMKIQEALTKLRAKRIGIDRQDEIISSIINKAKFVANKYGDQKKALIGYRKFTETGDMWMDAQKVIDLNLDAQKKKTDDEGRFIYNRFEIESPTKYGLTPEDIAKRSPLTTTYTKHYSFTQFAIDYRDLKRYKKTFLDAYGITLDFNDPEGSMQEYKNRREDIKTQLNEEEGKLLSKEYKQQATQEVIEEKERQKVKEKTLEEVVQDFSRLNYLLDKKKVDVPKQPMFTTCPPKDAEGRNAITPEALSYLTACISKEPQTRDLYLQSDGTYTTGRKELHESIVKDAFQGVRCVKRDRPVAILTGGSPGAGKTQFIQNNAEWLLRPSVFHIDADAIREKLPEYKGWNAGATHLETRDIVEGILQEIGSEKCRFDLVYDGTMARSEKYFGLIRKLRDLGYDVYVIFMEIPYAEAKRRVLERYRDGGEKGRYVDVAIVDQFFEKVGEKSRGQASLDALKPLVDGYIVADGISGRVLEKGGKPIPVQRPEDIYGEPLKKAEAKPEPKIDKDFIERKISGLRKVAMLVEGEELDMVNRRIKALKLVLSLM